MVLLMPSRSARVGAMIPRLVPFPARQGEPALHGLLSQMARFGFADRFAQRSKRPAGLTRDTGDFEPPVRDAVLKHLFERVGLHRPDQARGLGTAARYMGVTWNI